MCKRRQFDRWFAKMITAISIATTLVAVTVLIHFEGLQLLSRGLRQFAGHGRWHMLIIIYGVIVVHILEIAIYGFGYWLGDIIFDIGQFAGVRAVNFREYIFFSAETFTSLGLGDVYPLGALRLIASVEVLNGLILIGWSTSFTFLVMIKYWGRTLNVEEKPILTLSAPDNDAL